MHRDPNSTNGKVDRVSLSRFRFFPDPHDYFPVHSSVKKKLGAPKEHPSGTSFGSPAILPSKTRCFPSPPHDGSGFIGKA